MQGGREVYSEYILTDLRQVKGKHLHTFEANVFQKVAAPGIKTRFGCPQSSEADQERGPVCETGRENLCFTQTSTFPGGGGKTGWWALGEAPGAAEGQGGEGFLEAQCRRARGPGRKRQWAAALGKDLILCRSRGGSPGQLGTREGTKGVEESPEARLNTWEETGRGEARRQG